jgi:ATP-dependent DNA helicase RecQ
MSEYLNILKKYWGYDSFRLVQQDVIDSVEQGKDTLVLMPTGGGKSIPYQVFALSQQGVCLVISPLISLMKDQVDSLTQKGIKAVAISSEMPSSRISDVLNGCMYSKYKFLFIAPERIKTAIFIEHFKQMKVCLIVVDEAHCISLWGHSFRASFLEIVNLRQYKPQVPVLALTATATQKVKQEIQSLLLFKEPNCIYSSFFRENIAYSVVQENDKSGRIKNIYNTIGGTGLVYVRSRSNANYLAMKLQEEGLDVASYHAGLPISDRNARQKLWKEGKLKLMVATTAFGMGIDKADVRFIIHTDITDRIEAYFLETGRAGRDGK